VKLKILNVKTITFLTIVLIVNVFSSELLIEGKITSKNNPLKGANIYLINSNLGTTSDINGEFSISDNIIEIDDILVASYIGFKNDTISLEEFPGPRYFFGEK